MIEKIDSLNPCLCGSQYVRIVEFEGNKPIRVRLNPCLCGSQYVSLIKINFIMIEKIKS